LSKLAGRVVIGGSVLGLISVWLAVIERSKKAGQFFYLIPVKKRAFFEHSKCSFFAGKKQVEIHILGRQK